MRRLGRWPQLIVMDKRPKRVAKSLYRRMHALRNLDRWPQLIAMAKRPKRVAQTKIIARAISDRGGNSTVSNCGITRRSTIGNMPDSCDR